MVPAGAAWIGLGDGARLRAARWQLAGDALELTTLSGAKWKAEAKDLGLFMPQSSHAVYLSDIKPNEYRFLPYLEMKWPYKTDRNVTGGQLRCGGRLYLKGLGVHSAAVLGYKLDRPWRRFQAEVGIDDSTDGRGSVGFRIFVDGKVKYTSRRSAAAWRRRRFPSISPAQRNSISWLTTARPATYWTMPTGWCEAGEVTSAIVGWAE